MARLRYNGLSNSLGAALTAGGTTITFASKLTYAGGDVPTISGSDYIPLSILDADGNCAEVVYLTAYTSAATTGTIARGKEDTSGVAHDSGVVVVNGVTVYDIETTDPLELPLTRSWDGTGNPVPGILAAIRSDNGGVIPQGATVFSQLPGATFSQSSNVDSTRTAGKAADLGLDSATGCSHTGNVASSWWKVDFGAGSDFTVTRIAIWGRDADGAHPRNFKVQGFDNDAGPYTDLLTVSSDGPNDGTVWTSAITGAAAWQQIRILQTGANSTSTNHLVLGEVELYGTLA